MEKSVRLINFGEKKRKFDRKKPKGRIDRIKSEYRDRLYMEIYTVYSYNIG